MKEIEATRLREIRKSMKDERKSGTYVASCVGITPQYYYDIEKGKRNLSTELAAKLSDLFEVSIDYLIGKTDANSFNYNFVNESKGVLYETKSSEPHKDSELSEIPIERLNEYKLIYKGHELSKEEANDLINLLETALKRWK